MLKKLSNHTHSVITGVCLRTSNKTKIFSETTLVKFAYINDDEISFYVNEYKPYDKAGAYGIQEWLGMIAIEKIEGCYYNVMGLPVHHLYQELKSFCVK